MARFDPIALVYRLVKPHTKTVKRALRDAELQWLNTPNYHFNRKLAEAFHKDEEKIR